MSKRPFVIFGTLAAICVVVLPFLAIDGKGDPGAATKPVPSSDRTAQQLFATNCGACHTLAAGGTDGVVGPNLDVLLANGGSESKQTVDANCTRVLSAIENGIGGRMPKGLLQGADAEEVANFVARNVNYVSPSAGGASTASSSGGSSSAPITAATVKCAVPPATG